MSFKISSLVAAWLAATTFTGSAMAADTGGTAPADQAAVARKPITSQNPQGDRTSSTTAAELPVVMVGSRKIVAELARATYSVQPVATDASANRAAIGR
jgi:hypothetical protein